MIKDLYYKVLSPALSVWKLIVAHARHNISINQTMSRGEIKTNLGFFHGNIPGVQVNISHKNEKYIVIRNYQMNSCSFFNINVYELERFT